MKLHFYVGNDNGNSEQDIIIDGKLLQLPNVNCMVDKLPWNDGVTMVDEKVIKNLHNQLVVTIHSPAARPGIYYVGLYALESGEILDNMQVGIDNKSEVELPMVNTLANIAAVGVQKAYQAERQLPEKIEIEVDMATALPITQHTEEASVRFQKKFMDGKHRVTVHIGNIRVDVEITFIYVKVVPEGCPVIFALQAMRKEKMNELNRMYAPNGQEGYFNGIFDEFNALYGMRIDGRYFEDKRILHDDIGDGTSEYPVTEGKVFLKQFIHGSNHGAGHAIEEALPAFNNLIHIPDSPRQYFSDVLKNSAHKYYSKAMQTIRFALQNQAKENVKHVVRQLTRLRNEVDIIAVYGGSSILMRPMLFEKLKALCDEREIKLFYVPAKYAVTLNAIGLDQFVRGNIYKALKERAIKNIDDHGAPK